MATSTDEIDAAVQVVARQLKKISYIFWMGVKNFF